MLFRSLGLAHRDFDLCHRRRRRSGLRHCRSTGRRIDPSLGLPRVPVRPFEEREPLRVHLRRGGAAPRARRRQRHHDVLPILAGALRHRSTTNEVERGLARGIAGIEPYVIDRSPTGARDAIRQRQAALFRESNTRSDHLCKHRRLRLQIGSYLRIHPSQPLHNG